MLRLRQARSALLRQCEVGQPRRLHVRAELQHLGAQVTRRRDTRPRLQLLRLPMPVALAKRDKANQRFPSPALALQRPLSNFHTMS